MRTDGETYPIQYRMVAFVEAEFDNIKTKLTHYCWVHFIGELICTAGGVPGYEFRKLQKIQLPKRNEKGTKIKTNYNRVILKYTCKLSESLPYT